MSCWMHKAADKDKFPAPSHIPFGCFGWGTLSGSVGAELCSWHFLGYMSLQREGKKKAGLLRQNYLQILSHHTGTSAEEMTRVTRRRWVNRGTKRRQGSACLLLQDLNGLAEGWGRAVKKPEVCHTDTEWKDRPGPQAISIPQSLACPQRTQGYLTGFRSIQGLPLPQRSSAPWMGF